jgi:hypothetical protein
MPQAPRPDQQSYREFQEQLTGRPSKDNVLSGLSLFLALLFLVPLIGLAVLLALNWPQFLSPFVLLLAAVASLYQAYRGVIRREVRVLPPGRSTRRGGDPFGKVAERATGRAAVIVDLLFGGIGIVCLVLAVQRVLRF